MNLKVHFPLVALLALLLAPSFSASAQGFPSLPNNWSLPSGGERYNGTNYSFRDVSYDVNDADDIGSQSWIVMDMNGDSKLDLVVYEAKQANFTGVYGANSNPYWNVYLGSGTGFSQTATNWSLPAGGEKFNGANYSFRAFNYKVNSADDLGSQSWAVVDMNADGRPDLVVLEEKQSGITSVFSPNANPYWKVYLNNGSGFSTSALSWYLPTGGERHGGNNYGFNSISYKVNSADDLGSQSWTLTDMNGDSKPDLVVYEEKQSGGSSVFSPNANPYWKVHLNNGSGFSQTASNWTLPAGGERFNDTNYSFRAINYKLNIADDLGSQSWAVMDMNSDGKPDLVVYEEKQTGITSVFSPNANPYWNVYLNTGSGFATSAASWALPAGGEKYNGTNYSFNNISYKANTADDIGSQSWSVMDMNGDSKLDLVVYEEKQTNITSVFSPNSNPYWKVYLGSGAAFSQTSTHWSLPAGGEKYNGANYSFRAINYKVNSADDMGSQSWAVMDMDADGKPDLVVYEEKQPSITSVFSPNSNPYWKVYLSSGSLSAPIKQLNGSFAVYPNPVADQLSIDLDAGLLGKSYRIYDINGRTVQNGVLENETNKIDCSQMVPGIYFFKFEEGGQQAVKLIKR